MFKGRFIVQRADFSLSKDGTIDWQHGKWKHGLWKAGTWRSGEWMAGIWKGGTWHGGVWHNGIWKNGTWKNGVWENGIWSRGIWENGLWEGGTWKVPQRNTKNACIWKRGYIWVEEDDTFVYSEINPTEFFALRRKDK